MLQPYGINIGLKEHSNRVTPKAYTPKSPSGSLPPNSGPTQKTFLHTDFIYELYKTHDSSIIFKIVLTRRPLRVLALIRRP